MLFLVVDPLLFKCATYIFWEIHHSEMSYVSFYHMRGFRNNDFTSFLLKFDSLAKSLKVQEVECYDVLERFLMQNKVRRRYSDS